MVRVFFGKWSKWNTFCLLLVLGICTCILQYDHLAHRTRSMKIIHSPRTLNASARTDSRPTSLRRVRIAIGLAIKYRPNTDVSEMAFFDLFLNSFCQTASEGYDYYFYLAYDHADRFFSDDYNKQSFEKYFNFVLTTNCTVGLRSSTKLQWVASPHTGEPARAQNDAMMSAYYDCDCDYYFRTIDDSFLTTKNWTEALMEGLLAMEPPNVGMVAPNITHAPRNLLTVEFVHRTHFEIFGYYYPHLFRHWWADTWMNHVYEPHHKRTVQQVKFTHQLSRFNNRARYTVDFLVKNIKYDEEAVDKAYFKRYLEARRIHDSSWPPDPDPKKVISMSLYSNNTSVVSGALRNAQILPVYFPGWTLHLYIPTQSTPETQVIIPRYILRKFEQLNVRIIEADHPNIPPELYSWLALDDQSLEYVLVRNVTSRLSDRDHTVVQRWMETQAAFHCIRDHPAFVNVSIVPGAFGTRPKLLSAILGRSMKDILTAARSMADHYLFQHHILQTFMWPKVQNHSLCHDSVACTNWPHSAPFPIRRQRSRKIQTEKETEFIPAAYNEHHRLAYDTTYDNAHWWKPFSLQHLDKLRQCQVG